MPEETPKPRWVIEVDSVVLERMLAEEKARWEAILEVVDEQANDESLWFVATTIQEAYFQQELRRLHGVIEYEAAKR